MKDQGKKQSNAYLQRVRNGRVYNQLPFARELQRLLRTEEAFACLAGGYGFLDGGCYTLARAVEYWIDCVGPEFQLSAVMTDMGDGRPRHDHIMACYKGLHIDADGVGREKDVLRKWRILERPEAERIEVRVGVVFEDIDAEELGPECDPGEAKALHNLLFQHLGPFHPGMLGL